MTLVEEIQEENWIDNGNQPPVNDYYHNTTVSVTGSSMNWFISLYYLSAVSVNGNRNMSQYIDLTCVDEITFDYDLVSKSGSWTLYATLDNTGGLGDEVWGINTTTPLGTGTVTINTVGRTGVWRLQIISTCFTQGAAHGGIPVSTTINLTNISAMADYVDPVVEDVVVVSDVDKIPAELTFTATVSTTGICPGLVTRYWNIYKDGMVFKYQQAPGSTNEELKLYITHPGTYYGEYVILWGVKSKLVKSNSVAIGVETGVRILQDKEATNHTEPVYFYAEAYDGFGAADKSWSFLWTFGDGTTSTEQHPIKVFSDTGYTGKLKVDVDVTTPYTPNRVEVFTDEWVKSSPTHTVFNTLVTDPSSFSPMYPDNTTFILEVWCDNHANIGGDIESAVYVIDEDENYLAILGINAHIPTSNEWHKLILPITSAQVDPDFDPSRIESIGTFYFFTDDSTSTTVKVRNFRVTGLYAETELDVVPTLTTGANSTFPENRFGIVVLNPNDSTKTLMLTPGKYNAGITGVECNDSSGELTTFSFKLSNPSGIPDFTDTIMKRSEVYVISHDWILFSGYITDIETEVGDYFGNTTNSVETLNITCEGSTSLAKTIVARNVKLIGMGYPEIFKQLIPPSRQGWVEPSLYKSIPRSVEIRATNAYDALQSINESSGYVTFDDPDVGIHKGTVVASEGGTTISFASMNGIDVGDYIVYLKRDPSEASHNDKSVKNAVARLKLCGSLVSLGTTHTVSVASASGYTSYFVPSRTIDGDVTTSWMVGVGSTERWISFDLGSAKQVDFVDIYASSAYSAKAFSIQYSSDNVNWSTATSFVRMWSSTWKNTPQPNTFQIPVTTARYFRIHVSPGNFNSSTYWQLYEVVWGTSNPTYSFDRSWSSITEGYSAADKNYMAKGLFMVIKPDNQKIGFRSNHNTNFPRTVDIGLQAIGTSNIDTEYFSPTVITVSTSTEGRQLSATMPACVVSDSSGVGEHITYLTHPIGTRYLGRTGDFTLLEGHNLFEMSDKPTYFTVVSVTSTGQVRIDSYQPVPGYDVVETYIDSKPVTLMPISVGFDHSKEAFVLFGYPDINTFSYESRMYVADDSGTWTTGAFISVGSTKHTEQRYQILGKRDGYIAIKLLKLGSDLRGYNPKKIGCAVYKLNPATDEPFTLESPEPGSPIDVRGDIYDVVTASPGLSVGDLEVIGTSYIASGGDSANGAEFKLHAVHEYHSRYTYIENSLININTSIKSGDIIRLRTNDGVIEQIVSGIEYTLDEGRVVVKLGGRRKNLPEAINKSLNIHKITGL